MPWHEDAACRHQNGSRRPMRVWGRDNGRLVLLESDCEMLYCPECERRPKYSEGCVKRRPNGRRPPSREMRGSYASKAIYTEDDLAARVGLVWLTIGMPPKVKDLYNGRPSSNVILSRLGGIKFARAAGKEWLKKEGKWNEGLER